jgi:hypothetical protein
MNGGEEHRAGDQESAVEELARGGGLRAVRDLERTVKAAVRSARAVDLTA